MKKKSLFLLTFAIIASTFSMKVVDDIKTERAFDKAFAQSVVVEQKVKIKQASIKKNNNKTLSETENFEDIESLIFTNPKLYTEEIADGVNKEAIDEKELLIEEVLVKDIIDFKLRNKLGTVLSLIKEERDNKKFELSLSEPVKLTKVISKKIESTNWSRREIFIPNYGDVEMIQLAQNVQIQKSVSKSKSETDRISMIQSSTKISDERVNESPNDMIKNISVDLKKKKQTDVKLIESDDLVFFDYSSANEETSEKSNSSTSSKENLKRIKEKASIITNIPSNTLKSVKKGKTSAKTENQDIRMASDYDKEIWNLINEKPKVVAKVENELTKASSLIKNVQNSTIKSDYILYAYQADSKEDLKNFDIRFNDDRDDIASDNGNGEVVLKVKINNNNSIRRATILSKGNYPTTLDIVYENAETLASVPVLSRKHMARIMSTQNLRGDKAHLLVELDNKTEDIDINTQYERKIYLDKSFKVINRADSDYNFIMIVGVKPGNTILSFKTNKNETVSKIIHLESEEIFYDPNFYIKSSIDEFDLFEENLLSKSTSPLSLDAREILGLTFENEAKKLTLNKYQYKNITYPSGTRSYIELKHLDESIFVGRWNNEQVKIPSETYMRFVLGQFSLGSVGNQCLVQINLTKEATDIYMNGKSADQGMRIDTKILDKDGLFYSDLSPESEKIFILGEEQGIINVQIKYIDGSTDYLQSYCSDSTYLVEQL